ncbi:hypothetical protein BH09PSE5_BH09PSE5_44210 [soil metagenome]
MFSSVPIRLLSLLVALLAIAPVVRAAPIEPTRDDEVVEVLPGQASERAAQRRQRQLLSASPRDPKLALEVATRLLDQAHVLGDPRFAGQALAALEPWSDASTTPVDILMLRATLKQYLHEFEASAVLLRTVLERSPAQPQAWLTLATVRRVQGRYAESDESCQMLLKLRVALHGKACLAENAALRGQWDSARTALTALLDAAGTTPSERGWLLTTLAELEQRAGNAKASEAAYRAVLKLGPDSYATLAFADFLIDQRRPAEALKLLQTEVRTDPVVLRLAIAGTQARAASAAADVADMRGRIAQANLRPDARLYHGREQAMFQLQIEARPQVAFDLARLNATNQREPLDILVLAATAKALNAPAAMAEARKVAEEMGLKDRRIDALL